ncbi:DUF4145 domain-containing protein [Burkholderia cenocepacia]|nr:DUF4145 domain-containing protein [Burkholderia cenocepacia]RQV88387.1 DUF4145 domain-containing protein [Burkholderia cenocepacia]
MDRTPYQLPFTIDRVPAWRCPVCLTGHLTLDKKSLVIQETAASLKEHDHEAWEPDWIRSVFACVFQCSNENCREPVACSGVARVEHFEYEDEGGWFQSTEELLTPHYFYPPLVLMDIPKKCPETVAGYLYESFALFFVDAGAALNCARTAVEALLTALGVKRFTIVRGRQPANGKGAKRSINLHQRIQLLPPKYQEQKDLLLAVKWLGNAGSHDGGKATTADLRVAYDLLEHVLAEIYEGKGKKLKAVALKVNRRKGPAK